MTDRESEWETESHATATVSRNKDGSIQYIKCRAEYYEVLEHEVGEDEFEEGVSAKYKFDVLDGDLAVLDDVTDIEDDASNGHDTNLSFLRTVPIAEEAVRNVPDIEHVQETKERILAELGRGETATL